MIPTPPFPTAADAPIGVFDSGVGGLSVLRHIRALLPQEHLIYLADSGYAPYGGRTEAYVVERALAIAAFLTGKGVKALVVACNTATVAAIKAVRAQYPELPVVGVEPGLKPGAAATRNGKVGVLATVRTLQGEKLLLLRDQIAASTGAQFLLQPCPGLVDLIEQGELDGPAIDALLAGFITPLIAAGADTLVLGCTHYVFVREAIERAITAAGGGDVTLIDTGDAVARQLERLLEGGGLQRPGSVGHPPLLHGYTTGGIDALAPAFRSLLQMDVTVETLKI